MPALSEGIWIFPQLGRPRGFETLRDSVLAHDAKARVVVIFEDDDEDLVEVQKMVPKTWSSYVMSPGVSTAQKLNYAVCLYPTEKFYGLLANDVEIRTQCCLQWLAQECPPFGLSYCKDRIQDQALATHPCVSGDLVKALGWWAYPKAAHNGIDVYLTNIAYDCGGCAYLNEHEFLHNHFSVERSEFDDIYLKAKALYKVDKAADAAWRSGEGVEALKRVRKAMAHANIN